MDDRQVSDERLEVIGSGSSERRYSAMRDQAERGRDFQRRVRWMWLRRDLVMAPEGTMLLTPEGAMLLTPGGAADLTPEAEVIDLRDSTSLSSTEVREEPLQQDSA
jgi:hypothetical protein